MKLSLYIYRFLVITLSFCTINPFVISTLKISKALNTNEDSSTYIKEKIKQLPISIQPFASKIFYLKPIYEKLQYDWPSVNGLPTSLGYYLRWSLSSLLILIILIMKKINAQQIFENLINLYLQKNNNYSRQSKFFVFFIIFAFLSWILRLHWGFWNFGIWGWNMNYNQSLIPIENYEFKKILKKNNSSKCFDFEEDFLLTGINLFKLPNNYSLRDKSKTADYVIETKYYLALDTKGNNIGLISNGMFGFIFPSIPLKIISRDGLNETHLNIINRRLENYKNFKGQFRIPFKFAYPPHTPFNKDFTNGIKRVDKLALLNVIYKINLSTKNISVLNFDIVSEFPNCGFTKKIYE